MKVGKITIKVAEDIDNWALALPSTIEANQINAG